jgi:hypothetical protein
MNTRFSLAIVLILLAAASRLVPHPYNFSPIDGLALFSGAIFARKKIFAFLIPMIALFLGDLILGFHETMVYIYAAVGLMAFLGRRLGENPKVSSILQYSLLSSVLFFAITNFGVWMSSNLYPHTSAGLGECFIAALPFFHWTVIGDLFFAGVLFGIFQRAEVLLKSNAS